ncbi:MAG: hypothetical protein KJN92_15760 [Gemmatimonadetes bacterium]|nr:hypothetical protein [Gemmatimonadota bacterium]
MKNRNLLIGPLLSAALFLIPGCQEESGSVPEVSEAELTAEVPELSAVHEFMQPLWHDAFPAKDFDAIRELVPQFEPSLTALDAVELPGILRDKQAGWDEGKANLQTAFDGLKAAVEAGDEEGMLGYAETFHMLYEGLVRIVRPPLPELEAVHQHLYGLYHHYGPGYDLEKIRRAATDMAAAIPALQEAELPSRLADHQGHFEMVVTELGEAVGGLMAVLDDPSRSEVDAAIDAIHSAYEEIDGIFTNGSHG